MESINHLGTLAEVSITLAGFSGLIAAFQSRQEWLQIDKSRLLNILLMCFTVVVCALLPLFSQEAFNDVQVGIKTSCLAFSFVYLSIVGRFLLGLIRRSWTPALPWVSIPTALFGTLVGTLSLFAGLNLGIQPTAGLLGLILVWGIIGAGLQFVLTLQSVWGNNS